MATTRIAIVTGSDFGIGKAMAVGLAQQGCDVGITWHSDEEGAQGTAREVSALGRRAEVRQLDQQSPADAMRVVQELAGALGGVDAFVMNGGTGHSTPVLEVDEQTFRHVLDTDLVG